MPRLRHWPIWLAVAAVIALAVWAWPRRIQVLATLDGRQRWLTDSAAGMRHFAWQPGEALADLLPPHDPPDETSHPCLADGGETLYFTARRSGGDADIYRSRWADGRWQQAEPVTELNTPWDEQGVSVTSDGRQLLLSSNRRGGRGGFDLYVCNRRSSGWGVPKNLGVAVNTPDNEYAPAITPDGLRLYFASDRASATKTTDLYAANRGDAARTWGDVVALARANSPSNELSPAVAEAGAVLCFASNRPSRGRTNGFDLYRLRLSDPTSLPESLGSGINSLADEIDPAIADDGFGLVFSRRTGGGVSQLYRSKLAEVEPIVTWDTSRWHALQAVWREALIVTLAMAGLAVAVYYSAGWVRKRAATARFLVASLLLHAIVIWLMLLVPLSQAIVKRIEEIRVTAAATQMFDDNLHQSHSPGEQAYEKVADLKSVEATVTPAARQVIEPTNVPLRSDNPAPTIPLELARRLPAERLIFVLPPKQPSAAIADLWRRSQAAMQVAQIEPLATGPLPEVALPREQPIEKKVEQARFATPAIAPGETPEQNTPLAELTLQPAELEPGPVEAASNTARPADELPSRKAVPASTAAIDQEPIQLASAEKATLGRNEPQVMIAPREASLPQPTTDDAAPALSVPHTVVARPIQPAMTASPMAPALPSDLKRIAEMPKRSVLLDDEGISVAKIDPATEKPIPQAAIPSPQAAPMPAISVDSDEAGGPRRAADMRLILGALANKAIDAKPSLSPLATRLERKSARATPVPVAEDNVGMQAMFVLRQGDTRREFIELVGGSEETEQAVRRGLKWLADHQHTDGHWSLHQLDPPEKKLPPTGGAGNTVSDTAATGLGLLPFLAGGHTHQSGEYQAAVGQAVQWLVARQKPDGNLFVDPPSNAFMYSHGIATIAVCEAYGMTHDERLREPAQRAINFIAAAQHQGTGGWRYTPGESGDTSVVGWQVMALKSGEMAGLAVPKTALDLAGKWLDLVAGTGGGLGTFGYQGPGASPAMTAEGLLCRQFLGTRRNDPALLAGAKYLLEHLPQPSQETSYYWYYATQVMYHMQGDYWTTWNNKLRHQLVSSQHKDGPLAGTWDPHDPWEQSGGRLYATSLRLLMLETYYRHLPLYQQVD